MAPDVICIRRLTRVEIFLFLFEFSSIGKFNHSIDSNQNSIRIKFEFKF